jgi:hypothetical protein
VALIVKIDSGANNDAAEAYNACKAILNGFATLDRLNALRLDAIGVSEAEMAAIFGVQVNAQAYSDRWNTAINAWNDTGNTELEKIRVLVQPLTHSPQ